MVIVSLGGKDLYDLVINSIMHAKGTLKFGHIVWAI